MFYHNNDYLIPIIIGSTREKKKIVQKIIKIKKAIPHVFATRFSFFDKLLFKCHLYKPDKEVWLFCALVSYAENIDEYYTPAIIVCDENDEIFIQKYADEIEKYFMVIKFGDYILQNNEKEGEQ